MQDNKEEKDTDRKNISLKKNKGLEFIKDIIQIIAPALAIWIISKFVINIAVVQSGSMEPTLMTGNTVFYNCLAYTNNEIQRGDIILFWSDEYSKYFGKRVIGIPNDEIRFENGYVVINGQYADESEYILKDIETNCEKTFIVPEECYFLLGDNRENSLDSRFWQNPYIPRNRIIGRYMGQIDFSIQFDIIERFFRFD